MIGHILAALKLLDMKSLSDVLSISAVEHPEVLWMETSKQRKAVLQAVCGKTVDEFVAFTFNKLPIPSNDKASLLHNIRTCIFPYFLTQVLKYGKRLLSLGCF